MIAISAVSALICSSVLVVAFTIGNLHSSDPVIAIVSMVASAIVAVALILAFFK